MKKKLEKTFAQVVPRLTCLHWGSENVMTTIHNLVLVALLGTPKHESFIRGTIDVCAVNSGKKERFLLPIKFCNKIGWPFSEQFKPWA